jgi:C-terminal processing protease CtpA/Prc
VLFAACGGDATSPAGDGAMSAPARIYLNSALDVMQNYSFYRKTIDWTTLRANAIASADAARAQDPAATYPAIRAALTALGDHHSFFQPPVASAAAAAPATSTIAAHPADSLDGEIVGGRYGYVRVPTYAPVNGGTATQGTAFADTLQALIKSTDAAAPCGWIVDLRHNSGGNMWPMLAGVGPILGEGVNLGAFVDPDGNVTRWYYTAGVSGTVAGTAATPAARTSRAAYVLRASSPPAAVLTDARTASSGEAIAVAFRGRPNTRTFGSATFGVPTANAGHTLSDGGVIWLMSALDMDRTGKQYIDPLPPDEQVSATAAPATDDATAGAALAWLAAQPACKN